MANESLFKFKFTTLTLLLITKSYKRTSYTLLFMHNYFEKFSSGI